MTKRNIELASVKHINVHLLNSGEYAIGKAHEIYRISQDSQKHYCVSDMECDGSFLAPTVHRTHSLHNAIGWAVLQMFNGRIG